MKIELETEGWRKIWGDDELPPGAEVIGTVSMGGQPGVLVKLQGGAYARGIRGQMHGIGCDMRAALREAGLRHHKAQAAKLPALKGFARR